MPSLNNTGDGIHSGHPRRQYITTSAFHNDIYRYTTSRDARTYVLSGTLTSLATFGTATAVNCPANRILRENGRRLVKDANAGVSTLLVGVYDAVSGLSGLIDPNSPRFAMYNADKSVFQDNGVDPSTSLTNQGPPIYTRGTVTAGSGLTASSGSTLTLGSLRSVPITGATTYSSPSTTYTVTSGTNVFSVGQNVTVTGVTVASGSDLFNVANATVTAVTATTVVVVAFPNSSTGTATSATGTITGFATASPVLTVSGVTAASGLVTYTTSTAHNFNVGQLVTAFGFTTTAAPYNLTNVVVATVPSTTTFTVLSGVTGATGAGSVLASALAVSGGLNVVSGPVVERITALTSTTGTTTPNAITIDLSLGNIFTQSIGTTGNTAVVLNYTVTNAIPGTIFYLLVTNTVANSGGATLNVPSNIAILFTAVAQVTTAQTALVPSVGTVNTRTIYQMIVAS